MRPLHLIEHCIRPPKRFPCISSFSLSFQVSQKVSSRHWRNAGKPSTPRRRQAAPCGRSRTCWRIGTQLHQRADSRRSRGVNPAGRERPRGAGCRRSALRAWAIWCCVSFGLRPYNVGRTALGGDCVLRKRPRKNPANVSKCTKYYIIASSISTRNYR